jgi:RNA polymerase sigma factor (sigma-70 family)
VQAVLEKLLERGIGDLADAHVYARRTVVNEYRTTWRRAVTRERALRLLRRKDRDPVEDAGTLEDRSTVLAALEKLTDRQRAAVVMRYYQDLDDSEIADVLGCAPATVRSLVARSLPRLRTELEPDFGSTSGRKT